MLFSQRWKIGSQLIYIYIFGAAQAFAAHLPKAGKMSTAQNILVWNKSSTLEVF